MLTSFRVNAYSFPYVFYLNGCKKAVIEGTVFEGETPRQSIKTENMKRKDLKTTIK